MAIYHCSVKAVSRGAGRSATASAAYRAGEKIVDERTGEIHDYTRKQGVEHSALILPGGETADRAEFWNKVEAHHKRGDAILAREVEVALPSELSPEQRRELATDYARELADRYGVAADVAVHAPSREGDERNHHAHIMLSACHCSPTGELGKKAVEMDPIHCQRAKVENMADRERGRWAELANGALERAGRAERIDHRSLEAQGIDREPTQHLGPTATAIERRTEEPSRRRQDIERDVAERLARAKAEGEQARRVEQLDRSIIDTSGDLDRARTELRQLVREQALERDREREREQRRQVEAPKPEPKPDLVRSAADERAQEQAREYARAAADRLRAEMQAREQARQAADRLRADMAAKKEAERQAELTRQAEAERQRQAEAEKARQAEPSRSERLVRSRSRDRDSGPSYGR